MIEEINRGEEHNDDLLLPAPSAWFEEDQEDDEEEQNNSNNSSEVAPLIVRQLSGGPELCPSIDDIASPQKAPSMRELTSQIVPKAASELLESGVRRAVHSTKVLLKQTQWQKKYTDLGSASAWNSGDGTLFHSTLKWKDRQLVQEWRTLLYCSNPEHHLQDRDEFEHAKKLIPALLTPPKFHNKLHCQTCKQPFGPSLLRHHCRNCGGSFCNPHSSWTHLLPQYGFVVDERVCESCYTQLEEHALAERIAVSCLFVHLLRPNYILFYLLHSPRVILTFRS